MLTVKIEGLKAVEAKLRGLQKQIPYATSRALNNVAFKINDQVKEEMKRTFKGGATAYTLRAFKVEKATKANLTAEVALRKDAPEGGTPYGKALQHLFKSGTRDWKKLEGWLLAMKIMPSGLMAVPGEAAPLDARGNFRKAPLAEMLGVLRSNLRNLRVYRKTGAGKAHKAIGYFVVFPGDKTSLHPGIWKRIETGKTKWRSGSSTVKPIVMYVKSGRWNQFINLPKIGRSVLSAHWQREFDAELTAAMASAR